MARLDNTDALHYSGQQAGALAFSHGVNLGKFVFTEGVLEGIRQAKQGITPASTTLYAHPEVDSQWVRRDRDPLAEITIYTVRAVTNVDHQSDKYPPQVVYQGSNGSWWSRCLSEWPGETLVPYEEATDPSSEAVSDSLCELQEIEEETTNG